MGHSNEHGPAYPNTGRGLKRGLWMAGIALLSALALEIWASDKITRQGERTVYTVDCERGTWQGPRCGGRLVPAARYRFRALRRQREVLFWETGASAPSGKFTDCTITDGRNWLCKPSADAPTTITLQMSDGHPVPSPNGPTKQFHAVPKWRWWLLRTGIRIGGDTADN
jgi:hypothetical protein